jgi:hypothetical protein
VRVSALEPLGREPVVPVTEAAPLGATARAGSGARWTAAILLIVSLAAAISVDVVKTGYGVKGDEATYVSMALSAAFDRDLTYRRRDLERFWGLYRWGPDGIFLKRGKQWHVSVDGSAPFVHVSRTPDPRSDRLYFGKALVYAVVVAPFVRLFGLNGFLVFNVLLLFGVCVCGYYFLAARSAWNQRSGAGNRAALAFTLAFVGATVVPVYAVFMTSDLFNFALVFFGYFAWLYKEVARPGGPARTVANWSDVAAAVLLGMATFSKPLNVLLIGPPVLLLWWRRRLWAGVLVGIVFAATVGGLFGLNALSSGEFNYQGGDRRTFYTSFPFDSPDHTWEKLAVTPQSVQMTTNDTDADNVLDPSEFPNRFFHNVEYFFLGRHFGFVPYFFPGCVILVLWLASRSRSEVWRVLTFLGLAASTLVLLVFFPYTWSGGGGPVGNRYFLNLYPVLFFLTPPLASMAPAMIAWIGGALFTAQLVLNPFVAAKLPIQSTERGAARRLPVELTMANDLPVALDVSRAHVLYSENPVVLLYFLDERSYIPDKIAVEPRALWVSGSGRSDIIVRTEQPLDHLRITAESPIRTVFTASAGAATSRVPIVPGQPAVFDVPASGVRGLKSYAYLLSVQSSEGFTEHLRVPSSDDKRNLGVMIRFTAVLAPPGR